MNSQLLDCALANLPIAAIDFESAGAAPGETDQPVQIGIVRVEKMFGREHCFTSYLACSRPVRWSAARVHGITTEKLKDAPPFATLWPEVNRLLTGCVVLGHNPSTEIRFLSVFPGHGFGPWLDTLSLARQAAPMLKNFSLSSVCDALGITSEVKRIAPHCSWHDALFDAAGSLTILRTLVRGLQMEDAPLRGLSFALHD